MPCLDVQICVKSYCGFVRYSKFHVEIIGKVSSRKEILDLFLTGHRRSEKDSYLEILIIQFLYSFH